MVDVPKNTTDLLADIPAGVALGTSAQDIRNIVVSNPPIGNPTTVLDLTGVTNVTSALLAIDTAAVTAGTPVIVVAGTYMVGTVTLAANYVFNPGAQFIQAASSSIITFTGFILNAPRTCIFNLREVAETYAATSVTVVAGGTGYAVGNVVTLTLSGSPSMTATVASVSGGVVTGITLTNPGLYTTLAAGARAVTGGAGTGLTLQPVWRATNPARIIITQPQEIYPEWFAPGTRNSAAVNGGPAGGDASEMWQGAMDALYAGGGGGKIKGLSGRSYYIRYPLIARNNLTSGPIDIDLDNCILTTDMSRTSRGFGTILSIGEATMGTVAKAKAARLAGSLAGNAEDSTWTDVPLPATITSTYFTDTHPLVNTGYITVHNGRLHYLSDVSQSGNYGVQFSNAAYCHAYNVTTRYCSQAFGFGSDVAPQNPFAYRCTVRNFIAETVNPANTYYTLGFFGYANDCSADNVVNLAGGSPTDVDGNGAAMNVTYKCTMTNSIALLTNSASGNSEGFAVGINCRRGRFINCTATDAKRAFSNNASPSLQAGDENMFHNGFSNNCITAIYQVSNRCIWSSMTGWGYTTWLDMANNSNQSNCIYHNTAAEYGVDFTNPPSGWTGPKSFFDIGNKVRSSQPMVRQSTSAFVTPASITNGANIQIPSATEEINLIPTGAITSITLTLPGPPGVTGQNQTIDIYFGQAFSGISWWSNAGVIGPGAPASVAQYKTIRWKYYAEYGGGTWLLRGIA